MMTDGTSDKPKKLLIIKGKKMQLISQRDILRISQVSRKELALRKAGILRYDGIQGRKHGFHSKLSKRQNTVETSTFGAEFVAMRIAMEMTKAMLYKLRMFGIPIEESPKVFGDNNAVISNSSNP